MAAETTRYAVAVPVLGSLILTHRVDGVIKGLKEWAPADRPYAPLIFWTFRIMVGVGVLMITLGLWGLVRRVGGRLYDDRWLLRASVMMAPAGFIAVLAGWITTEVGRQPFTVYGLMRTMDSASPIAAPALGVSLMAFVVVYLGVFGAGTFYILRTLARPPSAHEPDTEPGTPLRTAGITPSAAPNKSRGGAAQST
jgi:cytochrome d ubiquinol oxidase subunit I